MIDAAAVGQRILSTIEATFDAQGWDLPARRYLSAGSPNILAVDDEHLAVALSAMHSGVTPRSLNSTGVTSRGVKSIHVPRADFGVRLMRCVATVDDNLQAPTTAQLNADGLKLLTDPGRLLTALFEVADTDEMMKIGAILIVGDVQVIGPMGGLAGHTATLTVGPVQ